MCVQKPIREVINEDYLTGEFKIAEGQNEIEIYNKYVNNFNSVLSYQHGVWVTSIAFRNLFEIGSYAGTWLYSDTDSCYGFDWDKKGLEGYNKRCIERLKKRGYGAVRHNNRDYWLGVCELDGTYKEFITCGAKRYATRDINDLVKITVAGVPKAGRLCLNNDLHNFHSGTIFDGKTTGKLTHTYFFEQDTWIDENGNERGDSIDLSECDYLLKSEHDIDWESFFYDEIGSDEIDAVL